MALVTRKSGVITNRDATPRIMTTSGAAKGSLVTFSGTLESVSGDDIGSIYLLGSIPSNAVPHFLRLYCDDIGATTIADFGLYRTTADGGAVVDADFFASAVSLKDGALNGTDILHESAFFALEEVEKTVWEALGLASDPQCYYDVAATLTAAADAAGTISVQFGYAI